MLMIAQAANSSCTAFAPQADVKPCIPVQPGATSKIGPEQPLDMNTLVSGLVANPPWILPRRMVHSR
ncbi:MAG: hypothetical protein ACREOA_10485, partial [Candidatus Dormibacteria bacterium]